MQLTVGTCYTTENKAKITRAIIDLDDGAIARIRHLARAAKSLRVVCIAELTDLPRWFSKLAYDGRLIPEPVVSPMLVVQADSFYWTCSERGSGHTSNTVETDWTNIEALPAARLERERIERIAGGWGQVIPLRGIAA